MAEDGKQLSSGLKDKKREMFLKNKCINDN